MKKKLFILLFATLGLNSYCQKGSDTSIYIQFIKLTSKEDLVLPISIENETTVLKHYVSENEYAEKVKSLIPSKNLNEIIGSINNDENTLLVKGDETLLFTHDEIFQKHKNFTYQVPPVSENETNNPEEIKRIQEIEKESRLKAINNQKATLKDYEQTIYKVSNIYFDNAKTFCVLYLVKSTVGEEIGKIFIYSKLNGKWTLKDCALNCNK
jgi:hypothetical protein